MMVTGRTPRILAVEDSATQAAALMALLEEAGFETVLARRAERALEVLAEQPVDLVLSDVLMPGMDGYELARRIRSVPAWSELPIVLLTSLSDPLAIVRGLESGADHYVTKPYEPAALLDRVRAVLARSGEARMHPKPVTVELLGTPFTISATKEQILELLVSSYSDLVRTSEAVREAERRARFLSESTELLGSSLDVRVVLRDLARLAVPRIADVCAADLLGAGGLTHRVEVVHEFGTVAADDDDGVDRHNGARSAVVRRAVDEATSQFVAVADDATLADVARCDELLGDMRRSGPFALLVVPLVARRRVLAVLQFLSADASRLSSPEARQLVDDLARRAAVAVDNALLYREAQRATQARDDVMAIVSHDLRNPLSTIHMSSSFLLDMLATPGAEPPLVAQLQLIQRATARGNALIQDLLDVSRIESGTLAVDAKPTSAQAMLDDAVAELEPLVAAKGLAFEHEWTGDDAMVMAERGRIAQVLSNLVGNAIKFTERGGTIRLGGTGDGGDVQYVVSDTGAGIAADHLPRLFDRFWKENKASRTGAGLGLFIVKGIVEGHGGRLIVDSELGVGTRFRVVLPGGLAEGHAPASAESPDGGTDVASLSPER